MIARLFEVVARQLLGTLGDCYVVARLVEVVARQLLGTPGWFQCGC